MQCTDLDYQGLFSDGVVGGDLRLAYMPHEADRRESAEFSSELPSISSSSCATHQDWAFSLLFAASHPPYSLPAALRAPAQSCRLLNSPRTVFALACFTHKAPSANSKMESDSACVALTSESVPPRR